MMLSLPLRKQKARLRKPKELPQRQQPQQQPQQKPVAPPAVNPAALPQAAVPPSSLDTGISLTTAAARMIAMTSARRSQVRSRRHQFSILEPCSRAIIAARVRLQRCCARLAAEAMRKSMVCPTKEALEVAYTSCGLLGGRSIDVSGRGNLI
mgnify:CR=1 FL=1